MPVLRSREVLPIIPKPEPVQNRAEIEPATPLQNREAATLHSPDPTSLIRRSARLASKSSVSGDDERVDDRNDARRKRKLDVSGGSLCSESEEIEGFLSPRSGKKLTKKKDGNDGDVSMEPEKLNAVDLVVNDKGKGLLIDLNEDAVAEESEIDWSVDEMHSAEKRGRFSREEKGKAKLVDEDVVVASNGVNIIEPELEKGVNNEVNNLVDVNVLKEEIGLANTNESGGGGGSRRMEQFRSIARQNASRFAHFEDEREVAAGDVERGIEDWPGPFSTAMKIIRDRSEKLNRQQGSSNLGRGKATTIKWKPRNGQGPVGSKISVPSLKELSMKILVKNADAITSLENVPDALRHKLSQMLCDSRVMNSHFLDLLVRGSPTEIRLRDCSWLTEQDFTKSFEGCDTSNLMVLQLDRCGRCMPDYTLFSTLARSINCLPSLTTLSICGACRLSDDGLRALASSAPALRCVNLSQCSLLTSTSIGILADSLGSVLQELYINDCQRIDAVLILPALKKLGHLEVLSVAGIETVSDDFVGEFVRARGHNMKELILSDCVKLTDFSLKVIAEACPGLCTLDISNMCKLTDFAIGYLANGCHDIQTLKLCRNSFSDEAIAAFLETSGESLRELSLNNVKKVAHNTALSLARRAKNLINVDLSWCRDLTNEAVGLIVDSCSSLRMVKLFGCTQITNVFLDGHSNPDVKIIGLKMSPVLKHLKVPDAEEVPLHYFSVLSLL